MAGLAREDPVRRPRGRGRGHRLLRPAQHRLPDRRRPRRPGGDGPLQRLVPRMEDARALTPRADLRAARAAQPDGSPVRVERGRGDRDHGGGLAPAPALAGGPRSVDVLPSYAGAGERGGPHRQPSRRRSQHHVPCAGFALLVGAAVVAGTEARRRRGGLCTAGAVVVLGLAVSGSPVSRLRRGSRPRSGTTRRHSGVAGSRSIPPAPSASTTWPSSCSAAESRRRAWCSSARALALRPDRSEFHGNYGLLLLQMGRREEGEAELRYRLARNPATSPRARTWASP